MTARTWQGMPEWLIYAVRWQHAQAMTEGRGHAGDDAVQYLTDKLLADDPLFARVVVERYVRALIRAPKARKRAKPGAREQRMARCARMHAEGQSLRSIGQSEGISHTAVRKFLSEWETRLPEMDPALIAAATPVETPAVNLQSSGFTSQVSSNPNVIPLRRLA